jgi:hypothetical protein
MPEMKHTSTPAKLSSKIYGNNDGGGKIFAQGPGTGTFVPGKAAALGLHNGQPTYIRNSASLSSLQRAGFD